MSVKELILPSTGFAGRLRANDMHDRSGGVVLHVESGMNSLQVTLDRGAQHLLMLYLQERIGRN